MQMMNTTASYADPREKQDKEESNVSLEESTSSDEAIDEEDQPNEEESLEEIDQEELEN